MAEKLLFDINETLARHLATGGGAAYMLRERAEKDLPDAVAELFGARTDVRRLASCRSSVTEQAEPRAGCAGRSWCRTIRPGRAAAYGPRKGLNPPQSYRQQSATLTSSP